MARPSEHRLSVTLTGGLRAALAAYAEREGISQSQALQDAAMHLLNVDRNGRPLGKRS